MFFLEKFDNTEFSIAQYSIRYKSVISTSSRLTLVNAEVMKGNETAMAASERQPLLVLQSYTLQNLHISSINYENESYLRDKHTRIMTTPFYVCLTRRMRG